MGGWVGGWIEESIEGLTNHPSYTAMSGLMPDARTLVDHARVEAQNHRFSYNEPIRVEALTQVRPTHPPTHPIPPYISSF